MSTSGIISIVKPEPNLKLMSAIKELLQLAETGQIVHLAYVVEHCNNDSSSYFDSVTQTLLGANAMLQYRMMQEFDR